MLLFLPLQGGQAQISRRTSEAPLSLLRHAVLVRRLWPKQGSPLYTVRVCVCLFVHVCAAAPLHNYSLSPRGKPSHLSFRHFLGLSAIKGGFNPNNFLVSACDSQIDRYASPHAGHMGVAAWRNFMCNIFSNTFKDLHFQRIFFPPLLWKLCQGLSVTLNLIFAPRKFLFDTTAIQTSFL